MVRFRRRKGSRKSYPITPGKKTLYGPPAHPSIAKEVHAGSVEDARRSVAQVERDFNSSGRERKEQLYRATLQEANRLNVAAHNHNNSLEERKSLAAREKVFRAAAERMHSRLYGEEKA